METAQVAAARSGRLTALRPGLHNTLLLLDHDTRPIHLKHFRNLTDIRKRDYILLVGKERYRGCDDNIGLNRYLSEKVEDFVPKAVLSFDKLGHMNIMGWEDNDERPPAVIPSPINIEGSHFHKCFGFIFFNAFDHLSKTVVV